MSKMIFLVCKNSMSTFVWATILRSERCFFFVIFCIVIVSMFFPQPFFSLNNDKEIYLNSPLSWFNFCS